MLSDEQNALILSFLEPYFGPEFSSESISESEQAIITEVQTFVRNKFSDAKYVLGLALDFTLLSQKLSQYDPDAKIFRPSLSTEGLFQLYPIVTSRGSRQANTLTLQFERWKVGIRKIEESVVDLFLGLSRPGYPSAYVYNTGQWQKFQTSLLIPCFQLSESARFKLCNELIVFGIVNLKQSTPISRSHLRVRLFEEIIRDYPRSHDNENGGTILQGIAAGFLKADRPHLYLIVDKTRTGSARQARIGDLDGYFGLDLEISVEVKDFALTGKNVIRETGEFLVKVQSYRVLGVLISQSTTQEAENIIRDAKVVSITVDSLIAIVETWDWRKQDAAVNGILHYLAHVEQNPLAVNRLLAFIQSKDPSHDSLVFYKEAVDPS